MVSVKRLVKIFTKLTEYIYISELIYNPQREIDWDVTQEIENHLQCQFVIVKSTKFVINISVLEICFVKESNHNLRILLGGTFQCSATFKSLLHYHVQTFC